MAPRNGSGPRHDSLGRLLGPPGPATAPRVDLARRRGRDLRRDRSAPTELGRLRWDGIAGLFYVANWRFVVSGQSYFDLFSAPSPFRHLWSLAIEEQFYLIWPLVTLGCLRLGRGRLRVLGFVTAIGAIGSVALMAVLFNPDDPSRAYYGTDTHAHTILIGVLLAIFLVDISGSITTSTARRRMLDGAGVVALLAMVAAFAFAESASSSLYRGGSAAFALTVAVLIASIMLVAAWSGRSGACVQTVRLDRRHLLRHLPLALAGDRLRDRFASRGSPARGSPCSASRSRW